MMDGDCLAVSCLSYSTEPISAITAKRVHINETAPSLPSAVASYSGKRNAW